MKHIVSFHDSDGSGMLDFADTDAIGPFTGVTKHPDWLNRIFAHASGHRLPANPQSARSR